jgi:hypothetical protein
MAMRFFRYLFTAQEHTEPEDIVQFVPWKVTDAMNDMLDAQFKLMRLEKRCIGIYSCRFLSVPLGFVAYMASYAISSSLILVKHVFVDTTRSQGCRKTTCQNEKNKGQNRARNGKEKTSSDEPTVPQLQASVQSSEELVHRAKP